MTDKVQNNYTASDALTEALVKGGITHIFLNSGTDYPSLIESWAKFSAEGREIPEIIICPHETVAMSAAQGYAQVTGNPQAVFVHVDVGTQNIGGAIANAFRARIPALVMAGLSPYSTEGELPGSRDNMIQYIQNASDQAGIVRGYVKHILELRSGQTVQQSIYRALQLAKSDVQAPVYLMAPKEMLAEDGRDLGDLPLGFGKVEPSALDEASLEFLADALSKAERPLVVTSYIGRNKDGVSELVKFCENLAIPVVETPQSGMNFPSDHPLHLGIDVNAVMADRDLILAIDCDVPWLPKNVTFPEGCRLFFIDVDPIKDDIPIWHFPAERFMRADAETALKQLNRKLGDPAIGLDDDRISVRRAETAARHDALKASIREEEAIGEAITPAYLCACIRDVISEDTIIMNETITNCPAVKLHIPRNRAGTLYDSGGSSLGWNGGAAIGAKLAFPDRDVVALTGDGSYVFTCPTAVHWVARKYGTPFLTVVFNNGGWTAPKYAALGMYPEGYAAENGLFFNGLDPASRYDLIAEAAGGAFAATVDDPKKLTDALKEGLAAVRSGQSAVINVILPVTA
ncbi:MAG: thiamine pyrophosphate-requiring protein [Clostridiales Family XIII bacterium]|jgi:acetolactate synthase-1/2/3 large subunit|nr:thiamine pyrophosphate-requiring protein [Clostridiales Family XIII bacterium]